MGEWYNSTLQDTKGKSGSQSQAPAQKDSADGRTGSKNIVVKNTRCLLMMSIKISRGRTIEAMLDSCATDSFIQQTLLPKGVKISSLHNGDMWRSATGHKVKLKGYITLHFRTPTHKNIKATIAILAEDDPMLANLWTVCLVTLMMTECAPQSQRRPKMLWMLSTWWSFLPIEFGSELGAMEAIQSVFNVRHWVGILHCTIV
ncbi:hypothetical protein QOT17_021946 [Balamuthia mandrillaris]